jgi:hypothetical protein
MSDAIMPTPDEAQIHSTEEGFDVLDLDDLDAVSGGLGAAADGTCKTCYSAYTTGRSAISIEES